MVGKSKVMYHKYILFIFSSTRRLYFSYYDDILYNLKDETIIKMKHILICNLLP